MVLAESKQPTTERHTLRNPYMARSALMRLEISFAQNVHVSRGKSPAPLRSSLMYGRKRLEMISKHTHRLILTKIHTAVHTHSNTCAR